MEKSQGNGKKPNELQKTKRMVKNVAKNLANGKKHSKKPSELQKRHNEWQKCITNGKTAKTWAKNLTKSLANCKKKHNEWQKGITNGKTAKTWAKNLTNDTKLGEWIKAIHVAHSLAKKHNKWHHSIAKK